MPQGWYAAKTIEIARTFPRQRPEPPKTSSGDWREAGELRRPGRGRWEERLRRVGPSRKEMGEENDVRVPQTGWSDGVRRS
jgi:hypothetical protein